MYLLPLFFSLLIFVLHLTIITIILLIIVITIYVPVLVWKIRTNEHTLRGVLKSFWFDSLLKIYQIFLSLIGRAENFSASSIWITEIMLKTLKENQLRN